MSFMRSSDRIEQLRVRLEAEKPPMRPKGLPKTGGRKKGTRNKCRKNIEAFAQEMFKQVDMIAKGKELLDHKDPRVQAMVWNTIMAYNFGRPREQVIVSGSISMKSIIEQARERVAGKIVSIASENSDNSLPTLQLVEATPSAEIMQMTDTDRTNDDAQVIEDQPLSRR